MYVSLENHINLKSLAKEKILNYIAEMDLQKSNQLPSEGQLTVMMAVSRVTIRAALSELENEELIFRRQGKGTFVNVMTQGLKANFNPVLTFNNIIRNNGYRANTRTLDSCVISATKEMAQRLQVNVGSELVISKKIFYANEKMCAYCIHQFSRQLIEPRELVELDNYSDSIFQFIYDQSGKKVWSDKIEIETTDNIQSSELNEYIHLPEGMTKAFLCIKGINCDIDDQPLVHTIEYIDTDIIKYHLDRHRTIQYILKE